MSLHPTRRQVMITLGSIPLFGIAGCATPAPVPSELVKTFAPTGKLRASINLGNPILAKRNAATGEVFGVSVDLARALARELGVEIDLVVFDAAAKSVDAVKGGQADIGFFAVDPRRSDGVRFSAPYVQIEGAYLVRNDSALTTNAQVDRAGIRVMVGKGSAYDLFLTRELKAAQILRAPTSAAVVDTFLAEQAEVAAGLTPPLDLPGRARAFASNHLGVSGR